MEIVYKFLTLVMEKEDFGPTMLIGVNIYTNICHTIYVKPKSRQTRKKTTKWRSKLNPHLAL
jgi:hypothetical protein